MVLELSITGFCSALRDFKFVKEVHSLKCGVMMADQNEGGDQFERLFMNEDLFRRLRELKKENSEAVAEIDGSITDIQEEFGVLRDRLNEFDREQRKLLTVLLARSIKRSLREILIQDTEFLESSD